MDTEQLVAVYNAADKFLLHGLQNALADHYLQKYATLRIPPAEVLLIWKNTHTGSKLRDLAAMQLNSQIASWSRHHNYSHYPDSTKNTDDFTSPYVDQMIDLMKQHGELAHVLYSKLASTMKYENYAKGKYDAPTDMGPCGFHRHGPGKIATTILNKLNPENGTLNLR